MEGWPAESQKAQLTDKCLLNPIRSGFVLGVKAIHPNPRSRENGKLEVDKLTLTGLS